MYKISPFEYETTENQRDFLSPDPTVWSKYLWAKLIRLGAAVWGRRNRFALQSANAIEQNH
jgi:hypothetical protein